MHQQPPRTVSERGTVRSALASPQSSWGDGSDDPFFVELSDLGIAEAEKSPVNFAVVLPNCGGGEVTRPGVSDSFGMTPSICSGPSVGWTTVSISPRATVCASQATRSTVRSTTFDAGILHVQIFAGGGG